MTIATDPLKVSSIMKSIIALVYTFVVYGLGIGLLLVPFWQLNLIGVIVLIHALVLSATFTHEFIHGNIFKERKLDAFWGQVMTHLNGACYATWEDLVTHHFNHHLHHADFVGFDILTYLNGSKTWKRWIYIAFEWLYLPIFELELRWRIILAPFFESEKRYLMGRTLGLMLYRTAIFALLGWFSLKALILYAIAYISFINIMRFADAFHHTYEYVIIGQEIPKRDRIYEQTHTFSNLVSTKYPWLNLLFLNFGYHNAHHYNMSCPWHELPQLHQQVFKEQPGGIMPLPQLVSNYHRYRISRLFSGQGEAVLEGDALDAFTGGIAVSFLTPP
jgi:fatty acid desaturase